MSALRRVVVLTPLRSEIPILYLGWVYPCHRGGCDDIFVSSDHYGGGRDTRHRSFRGFMSDSISPMSTVSSSAATPTLKANHFSKKGSKVNLKTVSPQIGH